MQVVALVWGILALLGLGVAFIPCLGWMNWLNIPFALVGLVIGIVALNNAPPDKKGVATGGVVLCAIAVLLGAIRLFLGGGIL